MNGEVFKAWVEKVFIPAVRARTSERVVSVVDNLSSHETVEHDHVELITLQSLFSYIRPGYIHSGYNRDHGGTTEPERSRNVNLKRTCHPVFVLDLTQNDLLGVG